MTAADPRLVIPEEERKERCKCLAAPGTAPKFRAHPAREHTYPDENQQRSAETFEWFTICGAEEYWHEHEETDPSPTSQPLVPSPRGNISGAILSAESTYRRVIHRDKLTPASQSRHG